MEVSQKTGLPSVGDYYLKNGSWLSYSDYTSANKPNIVGIYLGTNLKNQKIIISAGNHYQYDFSKNWWGDNINIDSVFPRTPPELIASSSNLALSSKLTGQQMTQLWIDSLESQDVPSVIKYCSNYTFVDNSKTWYCPSPAEALLFVNRRTDIIKSIKQLGLVVNIFGSSTNSCINTTMVYDEQYYWAAYFYNGTTTIDTNEYSRVDSWTIPFRTVS